MFTTPELFQRSPELSPAELVGMPLMLMTPLALTVMRTAGVGVALAEVVTARMTVSRTWLCQLMLSQGKELLPPKSVPMAPSSSVPRLLAPRL